jgi:hypothetical protein
MQFLKKARLEIAGLLKQAEEFPKKNFERMQNLSAWNVCFCRKKYLFASLSGMLITSLEAKYLIILLVRQKIFGIRRDRVYGNTFLPMLRFLVPFLW